MENDRRHEKSWNDPPLFSMDQLNKASSAVPLNKRYRYPQQQQQQAPSHMFQQQQQQLSGSYGYSHPNMAAQIGQPAPYDPNQAMAASASYPGGPQYYPSQPQPQAQQVQPTTVYQQPQHQPMTYATAGIPIQNPATMAQQPLQALAQPVASVASQPGQPHPGPYQMYQSPTHPSTVAAHQPQPQTPTHSAIASQQYQQQSPMASVHYSSAPQPQYATPEHQQVMTSYHQQMNMSSPHHMMLPSGSSPSGMPGAVPVSAVPNLL